MDFLHALVEERIKAAQKEGVFDNLPGKGKPLNLDDDSTVPEDLRLTYKVLKNSNCLPIEMELRKESFNLRKLLNAAIDEPTRRELRRELNMIALNLNMKNRHSASLDLPQV
jgi:Domain of unknown function (DUF1992)